MRRVLRGLFGVLVVLFLGADVALAQATAQISGTVRDASGGVLPGADVTAIQTDTGAKRSAVTNESGAFVLSNLAIGPVPDGGVALGLPVVRAHGHRAAGQRQPRDQRDAVARRSHGDRLGRSGGAAD